MMTDSLFLMPIAWMVAGALLLLLELLDGSFVFFLPSGFGAWLTALMLKLQGMGLFFATHPVDAWDEAVLAFALCSALAFAVIRLVVRRKGAGAGPDINQY